jgi:hypothetical protein
MEGLPARQVAHGPSLPGRRCTRSAPSQTPPRASELYVLRARLINTGGPGVDRHIIDNGAAIGPQFISFSEGPS